MRREIETKATTAATGYIDNGVCIIGKYMFPYEYDSSEYQSNKLNG